MTPIRSNGVDVDLDRLECGRRALLRVRVQLQVTVPANPRLDVPNGPQDQSGAVTLPIGDGTQPVVFFVRRLTPGAMTLPLVTTDTCSAWPSFVGGGPNAF